MKLGNPEVTDVPETETHIASEPEVFSSKTYQAVTIAIAVLLVVSAAVL